MTAKILYISYIYVYKQDLALNANNSGYAIKSNQIKLNWTHIWGWGCSSEALGNVEYAFIAITPKSTQTLSGFYLLVFYLWVK